MACPNVHVMLPCRAGSKRILNKNTRAFAGHPDGLLGIKLGQLARCRNVSSLVVTTDDEIVIKIVDRYRDRFSYPVSTVPRPEELATSDSLDKFVSYIPSIVPEGIVLWTHVTSPFFGAESLDHAISTYFEKIVCGEFDSLMGVKKIQTFLWDHDKCISHDRILVKWPQTQDLAPIYEVNSSIFMIDRGLMIKNVDRIGERPYLLETSALASFDIDWPDDFLLAEKIYAAID